MCDETLYAEGEAQEEGPPPPHHSGAPVITVSTPTNHQTGPALPGVPQETDPGLRSSVARQRRQQTLTEMCAAARKRTVAS